MSLPCRVLEEPLGARERKRVVKQEKGVNAGSFESVLYWRRQHMADAFCMVGVTATVDLRATMEDTSYEFGEACPDKGVAVISTARFVEGATTTDTTCGDDDERGDDKEEEQNHENLLMLRRRTLKLLAHEVGHLLGLKHCIYYQCVMNGWAHLDEMDQSPLHLCPVCLRKFHHRLVPLLQSVVETRSGHDVVLHRYSRLAELMQEWGLEEEAEWYLSALDRCRTRLEK